MVAGVVVVVAPVVAGRADGLAVAVAAAVHRADRVDLVVAGRAAAAPHRHGAARPSAEA